VAVCCELVGLISDPLMFAALLPAEPPVMPPERPGIGHVYVVPAGTTPSAPFEGAMVNDPALHMVVVWLFIAGFGFTVIVTVKSVPVHVPVTGVTV